METFPEFNSNERQETVNRFEKMLKTGDFEYMEAGTFSYLIEYYVQKDDLEKAITVAKIGLKQYQYSTELLSEIANLYFETGRYDEALEKIERAEVLAPQDSDLLHLKGQVLLHLDQFDSAIEVFDNLLFLVSDKTEIYHQLGLCYFGKEQNDKAVEYFKLALRAENLEETAFYELISIMEGLDMLEETLPFYQEYIDKDPYDFRAWSNLGVIYERLGDFEKAIDSYEYSIAINGEYAPALFNLGCCYLSGSELDKAIDCFKEVRKQDTWKDALVFINLGHCYFELGEYDTSMKEYQKALKLDHESYMAYYGIGRCLEKKEKWLESIHHLKKASEIFEFDVNVWILLAKTEYSMGNVVSALSALIKASEIEPEIPEIWLDWSFILSEQGDYDKALEIIELGLNSLPEESSLYYRAVVYLIKSSKYKEAFLYLENALTLNFEKHKELFEFFPELETQKALMKIIDQFSDVR